MSEMNGWYLTMRNDPEYYDKGSSSNLVVLLLL